MTNLVQLTQIRPSRWQPREPAFDPDELWELASSIEELGLINEPVVFAIENNGDLPAYELVAGERRVRACVGLAWARIDGGVAARKAVTILAESGLLGMPRDARDLLAAARAAIPVRIEDGENLERLHRVAVVENIERASLTPVEEARGLQGLIEAYGWSQRDLAQRIGKSQSYVAQRLSLLDLPEAAQQAVSTRVLSASHARAIARVPEALQPAVTEWAIVSVSKDDSPATTRQVQRRASDLAKFVDPDRWLPNGEQVYTPQQRNLLALVRWALGRANVTAQSGKLLALAHDGSSFESNLLGKKPISLVDSPRELGQAIEALGLDNLRTAWAQFASETGRTCEDCVFGEYSKREDVRAAVQSMRDRGFGSWGYGLCCTRWIHSELTTCEGCIRRAELDPIVLPVENLNQLFVSENWPFVEEPFSHVSDVGEYLQHVCNAAEISAARAAQQQEKQSRAHIAPIAAFQRWQDSQPAETLDHFQSHACTRCAWYRSALEQSHGAACQFVLDPLEEIWGSRFRAPEFGVLVTRDGRMLPRCEQFCYKAPGWPDGLHRLEGMRFTSHHRNAVAEWLHRIGIGSTAYTHRAIWGILRWLDYNRPVKDANDWQRLTSWLFRNWDALGGDETVAALLSVACSESLARNTNSGQVTLMNAVTGVEEEFMTADFPYVTGEQTYYGYSSWPKDFPKPWEEN